MKSYLIPTDFSSTKKEHVFQLQQALKLLGYTIDSNEFANQVIGSSTRTAIGTFVGEHSFLFEFDTQNVLNIFSFFGSSIIKGINQVLTDHDKIIGTVKNGYNTAIEGVKVKLFQKNLRTDDLSEEPLGSFTSLHDGSYFILYDNPVATEKKNRTFAGIIKVFTIVDSVEIEKFESDVITIKNIEEQFDISSDSLVFQGQSYFSEVGEAFADYFEMSTPENFDITLLYLNDLVKMSKATGFDLNNLVKFAISWLIDTSAPDKANSNGAFLNVGITFPLLYMNSLPGLPSDLVPEIGDSFSDILASNEKTEFYNYMESCIDKISIAILLLKKTTFVNLLLKSLYLNIVPLPPNASEFDAEELKTILLSMRESIIHDQCYYKPLLIGSSNLSVKDIIIDAVEDIEEDKPEALSLGALLFYENKGSIKDFINAIDKLDGEEGSKEAYLKNNKDVIKKTFEFGVIGVNHPACVSALKTLATKTINQNELIDPVFITEFGKTDLIETVYKVGATSYNHVPAEYQTYPDGYESAGDYYVSAYLIPTIEKLYPTNYFVEYISRNMDNNELANFEHIRDYFRDNEIDLITYDPLTFVPDSEADDIVKNEQKEAIKAMHRVFKMSPTPTVAGILYKEKIHSASQIYFMGKNKLKSKLEENGVSSEDTDMLFKMATARYASSLASFTLLNSNFSKGEPRAIKPTLDDVLLKGDVSKGLYGLTHYKMTVDPNGPDFPNIETLFGEADYCDCSHCQSVYSPAAYLSDMLTFLDSFQSEDNSTKSVKDILFERRPDIGTILLNCKNTETVMPYIDLVCEILESAVRLFPVIELNPYQTTLNSEELLAEPEHFNSDAYDVLKNAYYPMYSSFNLWQEQTRAYLDKAGIQWYELMENYQRPVEVTNNNITTTIIIPADVDIAGEFFGLTTLGKNMIICSEDSFPNGLTPSGEFDDMSNRNLIWSNAISTEIDTPGMKMSSFLKDTGLTCHEVLDLLEVKWVNLKKYVFFSENETITDEGCNCDVNHIYITRIDGPDDFTCFDKAHRFIRLWRKAGYKMWELDLLLNNSGINPNGEMDLSFLVNLKKFSQLQGKLNITCEELLAYYSNINNEQRKVKGVNEDPLYRRLFLSESIRNIANTELFDFENVDVAEENATVYIIEPTLSPAPESDLIIKNIIKAAFEISEAEYFLLYKFLQEILTNTEGLKLTLGNLSLMYRLVAFAKSLKLSMFDFIKLLFVTTTNNSPFESIDQTLLVLRHCELVKQSKFIPDEINYILYFDDPDSFINEYTPEILSKSDFYEIIIHLRELMLPLIGKYKITEQSTPDILLVTLLEMIKDFSGEDERTMIKKICDIDTTPPLLENYEKVQFIENYFNTIVDDVDLAAEFLISSVSSTDKQNYVLRYFLRYYIVQEIVSIGLFKDAGIYSTVISVLDGKTILGGLAALDFTSNYFNSFTAVNTNHHIYSSDVTPLSISVGDIINNYKYVLDFLFDYYYRTTIKECIAGDFKIGIVKADIILQVTVPLVGEMYDIIISDNDLLDINGNTDEFTKSPDELVNMTMCLSLINKIVISYIKWGMDDTETEWSCNYWASLAMNQNNNGASGIDAFLNVFRMISLKRNYTKSDRISLINVFNEVGGSLTEEEYEQFLTDLCSATGWDIEDVKIIIETLSLVTPADQVPANFNVSAFNYPDTYERIENCQKIARKTGSKPGLLLTLTDSINTTEENISQTFKASLKAKYPQGEWLATLKSINKTIREKKRDALALYLIEKSQRATPQTIVWNDKGDLYSYFLIDVEMSACQLTSRIKQAISAIQLFVQRSMLNLEDNINTGNNSDWNQWKWMKNYRVWEANRKVFLYPENWIEPELRDDKTPFFIELENELNQGEITADLVEDVFHNYLHKLQEVSNLEIKGIFHETYNENDTNILHVIARTRIAPHTYYYRKYFGDINIWSPWEKIEVDIKGDIVVPYVFNRKLHLFWLVPTEKALIKDATSDPGEPELRK